MTYLNDNNMVYIFSSNKSHARNITKRFFSIHHASYFWPRSRIETLNFIAYTGAHRARATNHTAHPHVRVSAGPNMKYNNTTSK